MQRNDRRKIPALDIPLKANRILNFVLIGMVLILLRVWHLTVIQHDQRVEEASRPQVRTVISPAKRGTIRDRFNIPLAINKVQYNISLLYSQIKQIPSVVWEIKEGKRVRVYKRREYIVNLSKMLERELGIDAGRIEDLIHSKASFYNNIPLVIKEDIGEQEYYRLKMFEKDWPGIHTEIVPKRYYPKGKVAGDIIGYMGAISSEEYESIIGEIRNLEALIEQLELGEDVELPKGIASWDEADRRLKDLIERAYTINDYVGKTGVEGSYEETLRGFHGKKSYFSDAQGNFLKELGEARAPLSGRRLLLTISLELQEYAEHLLIQNEAIRKPRLSRVKADARAILEQKEPWIKGGAIVALDPLTGDVLALASYPRFDPNDFITSGNSELKGKKFANIRRWFETEGYIAEVWNQKRTLEREIFDRKSNEAKDEEVFLTWDKYLELILPFESEVRNTINKIGTLKNAIELARFPQEKRTRDTFLGGISSNFDKILIVDLCRVAVDGDRFSPELLEKVGKQSLSTYHEASGALYVIEEVVMGMAKNLFHELSFIPWREENQKAFLKEMRIKEKLAGLRYAKPYIDLLDTKENELFKEFWQTNRWELITAFLTGHQGSDEPSLTPYYEHYLAWHKELSEGAHQSIYWRGAYHTFQKAILGLSWDHIKEYMGTIRHYDQLNRPLLGRYPRLKKSPEGQLEKHLASAFYPSSGFGYGRSYAFRQATTPGSVFKLVTSYAALMQKYNEMEGKSHSLNPLDMTDDYFTKSGKAFVGYDINNVPIPQKYKGGVIPRSSKKGIGKLDLIRALEVSSNPYFALLAGEFLHSPEDLLEAARQFSYGRCTGLDLPAEFGGRLPKDLMTNRNGLYATAIGQHSMVVTPLQTAVMLSAIANGGKVLKPKIVRFVAGETPKRGIEEIVTPIATEVVREINLPFKVREMLLEGMDRVIASIHKGSLGALSAIYKDYPGAMSDFVDLKDDMVGKSGTAESIEFTDLDSEYGTNMYNHIWFGGIVFDKSTPKETFLFKDRFGTPELVVVVYMRYGNWGRDAAPVAAEIAQKWREIKKTTPFRESL